MKMSKQTAVEWLEEQIKDIFYVAEASEMNKKFKSIYEQAKQMEKEQIEFTYNIGWADGHDEATNESPLFTTGEQYYKETYGGQDEH
jgi:hypothetical protein